MKKRVREISDREKYENLIDEYVQSGYKITRDEGDYCKLRKSSWGGWGWNIIIFVLTVVDFLFRESGLYVDFKSS